MTTYVLAFAFDDVERVVLISKRRPKWQAGLWNGVGGKLNGFERLKKSMEREFQEETGVLVQPHRWEHAGTLLYDFSNVHVFTTCDRSVREARTVTDEEVSLTCLHHLHALKCVDDVKAMVYLCAPGIDNRPFSRSIAEPL